ncbi:TPA: phage tail protein [Acinetobacter baumannii]|nr:phage tail protein [Acinetobacter baumannii]
MANLVFKYSWDHRPFPYNSAQGKRQFMLPFASGIPNLTPDWTQVQGAGTAATGTLTTSTTDGNIGRVMRVGDFGIGAKSGIQFSNPTEQVPMPNKCGFYTVGTNTATLRAGSWMVSGFSQNAMGGLGIVPSSGEAYIASYHNATNVFNLFTIRTTKNTTVDANGFIKAASPIVKLFANSIELNEDAKDQEITFEKLGTGDYLIKGSLGFAQEGWYIEIPKDANGNTVVAVLYETLENGDLSIKTYKRKFDFDIAAVVADLDNPLDIPTGRWIDIRLHEEPVPEPEEPLSETPVEFQPTNLSQAVAAAMIGVEPPEISDTDATL